ncbi:MAG: hypothetical protein V4493_08230 [Pseudomonadota bacterium]
MVYEKSALGYNEFVNEKRTLNVRERQVLLLINGIRNIDDLEKFFKKEILIDTIQKLESSGFIQRHQSGVDSSSVTSNSPSTSTTQPSFTTLPFFNPETTTAPINPAKFAAVKTILINATDDYLGLMGRSMKERISQCDNEIDLRNCISSWHMAMRESKLGRESTDFLMEQIHQTLENKMLDGDLITH